MAFCGCAFPDPHQAFDFVGLLLIRVFVDGGVALLFDAFCAVVARSLGEIFVVDACGVVGG